MGEWSEARKAFERKANDKGIHKQGKYDSKYELFWSFYLSGMNYGKQSVSSKTSRSIDNSGEFSK